MAGSDLRLTVILAALATFDPAFILVASVDGTFIGAAGAGDLGRVGSMLAGGVDIDGADKLGMTALMLAAQRGQLETVRVLLAAGANSNASTDRGMNAFSFARTGDNPEFVRLRETVSAG